MTTRYAFMKSGVWIGGVVLVVVTVVAFVNLGMWQLRRLDERRALNTTIASRMAEDPVELALLLATEGADPEALEYRRVTAVGTYNAEHEILLQARTLNGVSGHNVVTPLVMRGQSLAVNRGWVPIDSQGPPVPEATPPEGTVAVVGILRVSETRGPTGVLEDDGSYRKIGRLDLGLLAPQWGPALIPVYLQLESQDPPQDQYPTPLPPPETGEGAHLSYAIQWFVFAAVAAIGFPILVVSTARRKEATTPEKPSTPSSVP
ncbi:MAG: SURF1 family protein [Acidimicrobiia bacterium]